MFLCIILGTLMLFPTAVVGECGSICKCNYDWSQQSCSGMYLFKIPAFGSYVKAIVTVINLDYNKIVSFDPTIFKDFPKLKAIFLRNQDHGKYSFVVCIYLCLFFLN